MSSTLTNQLNSAFTLFLSLLVEAMPFLLLGVLFSGLLLWFIDERKLLSYIPRHPLLGAFVGSLVGFLFPVCECGNVPVARRLLVQGMPAPVAIGFLLAAPTINPIVLWATWTAFRDQPEIVVLRAVFSLGIATLIGWIFSFQGDLRPLLQPAIARALPRLEFESLDTPSAEATSPLLQSGTFLLGQAGKPLRFESAWKEEDFKKKDGMSFGSIFRRPSKMRWNSLLDSLIQELRELGGILVVGSAIAAIVQVAAPRELVLALGQGPVSSIVAMLLLASIVSICSTVDSFFALSFASTFTSGSLLAFLVYGPMIDLKGVALLLSVFKPRAVIYLMVLSAQLTFILTLAINLHLS